MTAFEKVSLEFVKFMRGKYKLDEVAGMYYDIPCLRFRQGKKTIVSVCQTAHCGRGKPHFIFGGLASPIVPYRNLPQTLRGLTADCRSFV